MSSYLVKTKYVRDVGYGMEEEFVLFCRHNNSCDVVSFYDEEGTYIFSYEDTIDNNLMNAIERLNMPHLKKGGLIKDVEYVSLEEKEKFKI